MKFLCGRFVNQDQSTCTYRLTPNFVWTQHVVKTLPAPVKAAFQVAKAAVVMYKRMQLNQKARYATRHRKK